MARAIRAVTVERGARPARLHAPRLRRLGPGARLRPGAARSASRRCSSRRARRLHRGGHARRRLSSTTSCGPSAGASTASTSSARCARARTCGPQAAAALRARGLFADADRLRSTSIDLRFQGQDAAARRSLRRALRCRARCAGPSSTPTATTYGYVSDRRGSRPSPCGCAPRPPPGRALDFRALRPSAATGAPAAPRTRLVHFGSGAGWLETPVLAPRRAAPGRCAGPLILESPDTTIVIPPGRGVEPMPAGNLVATLEGLPVTAPRSDHLRRDQDRARHHRRRHGLCGDAHGALADRARRARLFRDALRPRRAASCRRPRPWRCISARCRTRWRWCWSGSPATSPPAT